jgi:hypothetical protein
MMLSRGNDFRWLRDAKLPDTRNYRSKAYARPVPRAPRTKRLSVRARGNRWRYLRRRWYAPGRRDVAPSYRLSEAAIRRSRHVGYAREAQPLLLVMKFCQRIGDFFVGRAGKGSRKAGSCHVEEGTADAPKLATAA